MGEVDVKRLTLFTVAIATLILATALTAQVVTAAPDKTAICHRTASDSNPYVLIRPDHKSHDAHLGEVAAGPAPQHPPKNGRQDYIASKYEIQYGCGATPPPPPSFGRTIADITICQDPRAIIRLGNYDSQPRRFLARWVRAKDGEVRKYWFTVQPDSIKIVPRKWVLGKTMVWVKNEKGVKIASTWVSRKNNVGRCPVFTTAMPIRNGY